MSAKYEQYIVYMNNGNKLCVVWEKDMGDFHGWIRTGDAFEVKEFGQKKPVLLNPELISEVYGPNEPPGSGITHRR